MPAHIRIAIPRATFSGRASPARPTDARGRSLASSACALASLLTIVAVFGAGCGEGGGGSPVDPPGASGSIGVTIAPTTVQLGAGGAATTTINVTRGGGYSGAVVLSLMGAPAGVTGTFAPASLTSAANTSVLTLSAAPSTAHGSHSLTVNGSGQGVSAGTAALALTVVAPSGLTLSIDPGNLSIVQGANGTATVHITRTNFTGSVTLSVSGAPSSVTASVSPASVTGNSATLTVNVDNSAAPGAYSLTLTAQAQGLGAHTAVLALTVQAASMPGTWAQITTGAVHTCAVTTTGRGYCWGAGGFGILGNGNSTPQQMTPAAVAGTRSWVWIAAGSGHTCGITTAGESYCWGNGVLGALGNGSTTEAQTTPVQVSGGQTWASLAAGTSRTCGVTTSGAGYCWGNVLTASGFVLATTPIPAQGAHSWASFSTMHGHTCGVTTARQAYCWGQNEHGQLGDGNVTTVRQNTLVRVAGSQVWSTVRAGSSHTCSITTAGEAYCWGYNPFGELGDGSTASRSTPVLVAGGHAWSDISSGMRQTCGVTRSGDAYCWGYGQLGQLGNGTNTIRQTSPALVSGGHKWSAVSVGDTFACGVTTAGAAYCWGRGNVGQLGDGTTNFYNIPVRVSDP